MILCFATAEYQSYQFSIFPWSDIHHVIFLCKSPVLRLDLKNTEYHPETGVELTTEQAAKTSPNFKERHIESSRSGDLLGQDTMFVANLKGVGTVYLHACIDTYGSYAFGFLHTGKKTVCALF